jgi:hypothetical protein
MFMKRKIFMAVLAAAALGLAACGNDLNQAENSTQPEQTQTEASAYEDAVAVLTFVWDKSAKEFPVYGGDINNAVEGAPGSIDLTQTDILVNSLLIPEDLQANITDAASLIHMMNANTFTSAALKVSDISTQDAASKLKDSFLNTQYMCGFPDKLVIVTTGDYVVYAFGNEEAVDEFKTNAQTLENAELVVEQYLE